MSAKTETNNNGQLKINENKLEPWEKTFSEILNSEKDEVKLDQKLDEFTLFLCNATSLCKGPVHPATKYYKARTTWRPNHEKSNFKTSNNPQRHDRRLKEKRQNQYRYDLMQYYYYYRRKKAVQKIMHLSDYKRCPFSATDVYDYFKETVGTENNNVLHDYPISSPLCNSIDEETIDYDCQYCTVTEKDIDQAMKGINLDTAPGPDRVLFKVVKELKCMKIISIIANIMLSWNYVPNSFQSGRTILIFKSGDPNSLKNWRPITIFSILRRIIERALERKIRPFVELSTCQRGFISTPGTFINSSLINSCLQKSKKEKGDCCITFLDVSKAFDSIGHKHIEMSLNSTSIPSQLKSLVLSLVKNNSVGIELDATTRTKPINIEKGVAQGSPLSPLLFNLSIDFIYRNLNDFQNASQYGYRLTEEVDNLIALGFADDIALISNNETSAVIMIERVNQCLTEIGLNLNASKSKIINIKKGKLMNTTVTTLNDIKINSIQAEETIKYLGVTYNDEIILDKCSIITNLNRSISKLITSSLLKPDQKLNILNQYIWPTLIYPLQCAPLCKLQLGFLQDIDKIVKNAVKEIVGLPCDTPDSMLYTSRKYRGLGVMKATWEAFLQHINICNKLQVSSDPVIGFTRNFNNEIQESLDHLNISREEQPNVRSLRKKLREKEYENWKSLPHRGRGVAHFSEWTHSNTWISSKKGLSSSQWTNAIKMDCNVIPVRSLPGRSEETRCRHCNESETLPHILGFCKKGELLRNNRHHKVRSAIAKLLLETGHFEIFEEIHCISTDGSTKRADIIAIDRKRDLGYILDPTVRFEKDLSQAHLVNEEKKKHYQPCCKYLSEKYKINTWEVIGLLFGSRGTITKFCVNILLHFGIKKKSLQEILLAILRDSVHIVHFHLYGHMNIYTE